MSSSWMQPGKTSAIPPHIELPNSLKETIGSSGGKLLASERAKASFSSNDLSVYLYGQAHIDRLNRILAVIESEEAFDKTRIPYMSRGEKFRHALRKEKRLVQIVKDLNWSKEDEDMAEVLIDMPGPYGLHKSMFIKTLTEQGTDEQHELFLKPALDYKILGCYAQTEMRHGSNVAGLETTATFDNETKEFIINTPSLASAKYWIGSLGRTADHAVVMAQLYSNGEHRGIHPFVVPIRDMKTRQPFEGVTIGDIGPKAGYNSMDNGFMIFQNHRVPFVSLLSKFSAVNGDTGDYKKPANSRLAYQTMVYIRVGIVKQAYQALTRAATISVRYCSIRRQFVDRDASGSDEFTRKPSENQVLDYRTVQYRLFPVIATAFAFHYTAEAMLRLYEDNQARMKQGDFSLLADTHAASSGLKSICTLTAGNAIEECRRACGGHGFSLAGGLASQYADYLPQLTWEGDSWLLPQQTARYLFKTFRQIWEDRDVEMPPTNEAAIYIKHYLSHVDAKAPIRFSGDFRNLQMWISAFGHRAAYQIGITVRKRDVERRSWNAILVDINRCSVAHSQYLLVKNFADAIAHDEKLQSNPALHAIMTTCFELYACYTMETYAADFMSSGYINPEQLNLLRNEVDLLLGAIRPQAVPLVDSFNVPDYLLASALGRSDGEVYPSLFAFALQEPLNSVTTNPDYTSPELVFGEPPLAKL
ncbi:uncharacterized protein L969DRAFT_615706 [Mixia osmundae IAM 14324]|uniref:Acyl-coenzyme A oxidase n=1 Tax=Mixia osmundae (strain CBS 9802 / IAM 14324 / JCM 22182 / KY 12970) TaxID=764103 RepID=G7DYN6_MIXOS|nr:uncharacterized protein L969DRAFT_615706 [Mixia osmundae IAM 14324]KEI41595.1 hypothetical protein L969DRAFT_615706 [Mixia osmundae IAM 14324]GAA95696.1 hypothetical protein E5Q_02353 [Mixia osmundae IAM 14324]